MVRSWIPIGEVTGYYVHFRTRQPLTEPLDFVFEPQDGTIGTYVGWYDRDGGSWWLAVPAPCVLVGKERAARQMNYVHLGEIAQPVDTGGNAQPQWETYIGKEEA